MISIQLACFDTFIRASSVRKSHIMLKTRKKRPSKYPRPEKYHLDRSRFEWRLSFIRDGRKSFKGFRNYVLWSSVRLTMIEFLTKRSFDCFNLLLCVQEKWLSIEVLEHLLAYNYSLCSKNRRHKPKAKDP